MTDKTKTADVVDIDFSALPVEDNVPLPPVSRGSASKTSALNEKLLALSPGQSFLVPVKVPTSIKDKDERAKAFKEAARKVSNRISGNMRRVAKSNAGYSFSIRTQDDGVRVWRDVPKAAAAAA